ncbi:MAG: hypothetical protein LBV09_00510 [Deferribacteraceae bacterium]|jgi:hypothetical protein|nr:hypothetical protein [Deferribacteraceae bacterium]
MFERITVDKLANFSSYAEDIMSGCPRLKILPDGRVLLISNDEEEYTFRIWDGKTETSFTVEYYGQLVSVTYYDGFFWLEFHDLLNAYMEEYNIIKAGGESSELILSTARESYSHDLPYHHLFVKDDLLYLHLIRHNRLHRYQMTPEGLNEIDVMEGGKWFLCGAHALCQVGHSLELYDDSLDICNTIEYDSDIDEVQWAESDMPHIFAVTLTDMTQEDSALLLYHYDTSTMHIAYIEYAVSDMGISGGKVWVNPCGFFMPYDLGGCIVFDKFAYPLYTHIRSKLDDGSTFGTYPPLFHRTEGIHAMPDGMTLAYESNRMLVLDYNGRAVQEIPIPNADCFAVSKFGDTVAMLHMTPSVYSFDSVTTHRDVSLEIYKWNAGASDNKIIEMKFQK